MTTMQNKKIDATIDAMAAEAKGVAAKIDAASGTVAQKIKGAALDAAAHVESAAKRVQEAATKVVHQADELTSDGKPPTQAKP